MKLTKNQLRKMIKEEFQKQKKLNEAIDPAVITAIQHAMSQDPRVYKAFAALLAAGVQAGTIPLAIMRGIGRGALSGAGFGSEASDKSKETRAQIEDILKLLTSSTDTEGPPEGEVEEYEGEVEEY